MPKKSCQSAEKLLVGHKAIAAYLKVSVETTKKWIRQPEMMFPVEKIDRVIVAKPSRLDAWMNHRTSHQNTLAGPSKRPLAKFDPDAIFDCRYAVELKRLSDLATANNLQTSPAYLRLCLVTLSLRYPDRRPGGMFQLSDFADKEILDLMTTVKE